MIFAAMDSGTTIFVGACIVILLWLLYMATFRPDTLMKLRQQEEELKQKRHERMKEIAKGAGGLGVKMAARFLKKK